MRAIIRELQELLPQHNIELRQYKGTDVRVEKMESLGIECYSIYKDDKNTGIVIYSFNNRGTDDDFYNMIETLSKMIKLK